MNAPARNQKTHTTHASYTHSIKLLMWASIISNSILLYRTWWAQDTTFLFLLYNLGLAWIPLICSSLLVKNVHQKVTNIWIVVILAIIWILFYPNAPYLVTDLIHLKVRPGVPLWLDFVMLESFALTGIALGFVSLRQLYRVIVLRFGKMIGWIFIVTTSLAASFGIYLGRFLRWNSWDIFINPTDVLHDIMVRIMHPTGHPTTVITTLFFTVFLLFFYSCFYFVSYALRPQKNN